MKFRFFILVSLLCLVMFFSNVCFASVSSADLQKDLLKLRNENMISEECYQSALYAPNNSIINGSSSDYSKIKYGMSLNNEYAIILKNVSGTIQLVIAFPNTISQTTYNYFYNPNKSGTFKDDWSGYSYSIPTNTESNRTNFSQAWLQDTDDFEYIYTTCGVHTRVWNLIANEEYGGNYIVDYPPTFIPENRGYVSVSLNGVSENFHKLPFSLADYKITLGRLENYNTDSVYQIIGEFGPYIGTDNQNNNIIDASNRFTFTRFADNLYDVKNGSLKFDSNTGEVYILTNKLIENQGYSLSFSYYKGANDFGADFGQNGYYAVSKYFTGTSGDLINTDVNSAVDINFINTINDFYRNEIESYSGDFNDYVGTVFGYSGDIFGITFHDNDNWGFGSFFINLFRNIYLTLSSYEDVTINFGILGNISSSDFIINNSSINNFLGIFSNGMLIIIMIFFYYRFIMNVSTLDISSLFGYDLDHIFNLF